MNQIDSPAGVDSLPDSTDPNGSCPRCGRIAHFDLVGNATLAYRSGVRFATGEGLPSQRATIFTCNACNRGIVVIEEEYVGGVKGGKSGAATWQGAFWWPAPGTGSLGPEVPLKIADAYGEGQRCISANAPNGAVAMFRTVMTWIVDDKGSPEAKSKGDLKNKVKQMVADGGLTSTLGDWVDHIRLYGNAGVHPDLFGDVSFDEAKDVARLTETLVELLYITPSRIAQRQAARRI